jgi:hypothetical protein
VGVFEFDLVVDFYRSPVAKVETEDVETNIGGNIGEASRQENGLRIKWGQRKPS